MKKAIWSVIVEPVPYGRWAWRIRRESYTPDGKQYFRRWSGIGLPSKGAAEREARSALAFLKRVVS